MKHLSKQRLNKILNLTPEWMEGKITIYQVMKHAKCDWHTAKRHLITNAEAIRKEEIKIVKKLTVIDKTEKDMTVWERIKKRIWSSLLTEQHTTQPPK